jgi:hypothetical protein
MWTSIGTFGPAYNPGTSLQQPTTKKDRPEKKHHGGMPV